MGKMRTQAVTELVPKYEIANLPKPIDLHAVFKTNRVIVDFGCGMGHHTKDLQKYDAGILAIDVHTPGICQLAIWAAANDWKNVRLHHGDGVNLLTEAIAPGSVDELHVMFPDPWPKPRQHKRRLIQEPFLQLADRLLSAQGFLLVVTDSANYAEFISDVISNSKYFKRQLADVEIPDTRYRNRADRLGNKIDTFKLVRV